MENGPEDLRKASVQHSRQTPADHPRIHLHRHKARPGRNDRAPRRDPRHPLDATHPHDHLTTPALTKPPNAGFRHARERSALNVYPFVALLRSGKFSNKMVNVQVPGGRSVSDAPVSAGA